MSLTLLYRGKNVRFSMQLKKVHWLSALLSFAIISGFIVHLFLSTNDVPTAINTQTVLTPNYLSQPSFAQSSSNSPDSVTTNRSAQQNTAQKTIALTMKLAELQSQVLRLNALGDRLASDANIPAKEFNFSQLPPSGGPIQDLVDSAPKSFAQLFADVSAIERQLTQGEKQLRMLESLALGHHIEESSYLSGRPIKRGWLSSYFGMRKDPFNGRPAMHKGLDFAGKENSDVIATASGVVSWASERYGYGNLVEINHGNGLRTRYGHNKELLVKVGDVVNKGQVIAHMGSTGRSTGPHVHYEILRKNAQINPLAFVYRKAK